MEASGVWQNRIVAWGTIPPDQLLANPRNIRRHPNRQRDALRGSLDELGVIAPVIVNQVTGMLVDGHARVEEYITAGVPEVPVAYVELTEAQERLALAVLDPVGEMAVADSRALSELLDEVDTDNAGLGALLDDLRRQSAGYMPELEPDILSRVVDDDDIARAAEGLEHAIEGRDQIRVLCPHCGESLFVDRA